MTSLPTIRKIRRPYFALSVQRTDKTLGEEQMPMFEGKNRRIRAYEVRYDVMIVSRPSTDPVSVVLFWTNFTAMSRFINVWRD